jgi:hypothetical protein
VNDTTTPPDAGTAAPGEAEVQIYGGYMVKYRVSKDVPGSPHARVLVYIGEDEDHYRLTGTLVMLRAEADAFMREAALPAEGKLADAQNAIGQAIREVESWAMEGKLLDPSEVQRVLLGVIFRQWLGGLQLPEVAVQPAGELEAVGTGPLLDPDCKAGKCGSCVGAPCEHECHKAPDRSDEKGSAR